MVKKVDKGMVIDFVRKKITNGEVVTLQQTCDFIIKEFDVNWPFHALNVFFKTKVFTKKIINRDLILIDFTEEFKHAAFGE